MQDKFLNFQLNPKIQTLPYHLTTRFLKYMHFLNIQKKKQDAHLIHTS